MVRLNRPTTLPPGLPDVVVLGLGGLRVFLGTGDGSFRRSPFSYMAASLPVFVTSADLNCDGHADLAVANQGSNNVSILLNDGAWNGGGALASPAPCRDDRPSRDFEDSAPATLP